MNTDTRLRQRIDPNQSRLRDREDRIHRCILRAIGVQGDEMINREIHKPLRLQACDGRQNDQPGMQIDALGELAEIVRIFSHDNAIFRDSASEDDVVGLAEQTAISRMYRVVQARLVEMTTELGRNALVDEESHAALHARRETGRPTCGCVWP